jgi:hypothetical protein
MTPAYANCSGPVALFAVATKLLTIFVMLYAMSERDPQRTLEVAESFSHRSTKTVPGPVTIVKLDDGNAPAMKVVERRWLDLFPGAGMVDGADFAAGRTLRAELGVAGIFAANRADPVPSAAAIVGALTRMVADAPQGIDLALDVKLGHDTDTDSALSIQRVRTLARMLAAIDHNAADVIVGLQPGQPAVIALELRVSPRHIAPAPVIARPPSPPPVTAQAGPRPPLSKPGA